MADSKMIICFFIKGSEQNPVLFFIPTFRADFRGSHKKLLTISNRSKCKKHCDFKKNINAADKNLPLRHIRAMPSASGDVLVSGRFTNILLLCHKLPFVISQTPLCYINNAHLNLKVKISPMKYIPRY